MAFETSYVGLVESIAFGGAGVVRLEGWVIFIPGVLPGERIRFKIRSGHKAFAQGDVLEVLEPSPDRIEPECPLMWHPLGPGPQRRPCCPGCAYGHAAYARELALKQEQFAEVLARIGGLKDLTFRKPIGSPLPFQYRNKIVLHTQKDNKATKLGYLELDNRTVLDIPTCPLATPPINALLQTMRAKPGFLHGLRPGMDVTFRWTERDGALCWRGQADSRDPWLEESTPVGPLRVPRGSFFQVNPGAAALLIEAVQAIMKQAKPVRFVDLFCGTGLFSLAAAKMGIEEGAGLDSDPAIIAAAVENAIRHKLTGYTFQAARAELDLAAVLQAGSSRTTLLLVDPPRTGLELGVTSAIIDFKPRDIIYVSCAADTLARDLARLTAAGYTAKSLQLVDMFPRTAHFESVVWLRAPAARAKAPARKRTKAA
jgi:23S rRNA (uracil1939-C5)-methyltransferase